METNKFIELAAVNVGANIEQKGKFNYLSWSFALAELMRLDPKATWVFHEPQNFGQTLMVSCTLTAFDKPVYMWLPVIDHSNKAIRDPDAMAVNKAMMRCLVKAIAAHGLGLYIYAGEDLPDAKDVNANKIQNPPPKPPLEPNREQGAIDVMNTNSEWSLQRIKDTYALTEKQVATFEKAAQDYLDNHGDAALNALDKEVA